VKYAFVLTTGDPRTVAGPAAEVEAASMADAGATWWIEADWQGASVDSLRRRIEAGPPRIASEQ
jgi:hypothetical protein